MRTSRPRSGCRSAGATLHPTPCLTSSVCAPADIALVEEGRVHQPASRRLPFGGRDLTEHLARLLHLGGARGGALSRAEREALERAKIGCMRVLESREELAAASAQVGAGWGWGFSRLSPVARADRHAIRPGGEGTEALLCVTSCVLQLFLYFRCCTPRRRAVLCLGACNPGR